MSISSVCGNSGWLSLDCLKAVAGVYNPPKVISPATAVGGCGDEGLGPVEALHSDKGVPMVPQDATPGTDHKSLPTKTDDAGNTQPYVHGSFFSKSIKPVYVGKKVDASAPISMNTPALSGTGISSLSLAIEIGTNSTTLANMPKDGCHKGMVDISAPTAEDKQLGLYCQETGYSAFASCPSQASNRINFYLAQYSLQRLSYLGLKDGKPNYKIIEELPVSLLTATQLHALSAQDRDSKAVGVICSSTPNPTKIKIPSKWNSSGELLVRLANIQFILLNGQATYTGKYETDITFSVKAQSGSN